MNINSLVATRDLLATAIRERDEARASADFQRRAADAYASDVARLQPALAAAQDSRARLSEAVALLRRLVDDSPRVNVDTARAGDVTAARAFLSSLDAEGGGK